MPRFCQICQHPQAGAIGADLAKRTPYRTIAARYGVDKSAVSRHVNEHVPAVLQQAATKARHQEVIADRREAALPTVLQQMRALNERSLRILKGAEGDKDRANALGAIRETRRNLELIAKLTGELDPRSSELSGGTVTVQVIYADKA